MELVHVDFECDLDTQRVGERVRRTKGKALNAMLSIVRCLAQVKTHRPSIIGTKRETVQRKVVHGDVNIPFRSSVVQARLTAVTASQVRAVTST